jgi:MFS family permease
MAKVKIITRPIWILSLVSLFTDVASEMLYPVMPVYLKSIGFSIVLIGILEGFAEAMAGISKGYFGQMSDRSGMRVPFIRFGYGLSAFAKPLLALLTYPWWIFIVRTIERLGKGVRTSARDAFLSDQTIPEYKGRVFGFHRAMDTIGAAIGPVIALVFLMFFPGKYKLLFLLSFLPGIIALSLTFILREKKIAIQKPKSTFHFFSFVGYWKKSNTSYKLLIIGLLFFALFNSSDTLILLSIKEVKGYTDSQMIGFYIFYNLIYALFSYPIGRIADKIGLYKMLLFGIFLFSLIYIGFGFAQSIILLGILFLGYGVYASATEGISKALITNLCKSSDTATAIGFYNSFLSLCTLIASSIAGIIWFTFSAKTMFVISGIGAFVAFVYLLFLLVNKVNSRILIERK